MPVENDRHVYAIIQSAWNVCWNFSENFIWWCAQYLCTKSHTNCAHTNRDMIANCFWDQPTVIKCNFMSHILNVKSVKKRDQLLKSFVVNFIAAPPLEQCVLLIRNAHKLRELPKFVLDYHSGYRMTTTKWRWPLRLIRSTHIRNNEKIKCLPFEAYTSDIWQRFTHRA